MWACTFKIFKSAQFQTLQQPVSDYLIFTLENPDQINLKEEFFLASRQCYLWPFPHSLLSLREGKTVKMLLPKHCSTNTKLPWYFPVNLILLTWTIEKLAAHYASNWTTSHMTVICNSRVILQTNDAITGVNDPTTLKTTPCTIDISGFSLPQWATHRNLG